MSYNGSGTFNINTTGQPVVAGTVISSSAFNSLTSDLATGLTTAITKDGQTTTTARITFAQGITSSLTTDSSSTSTGSIITAGGVGIAKNLYVGGSASFSAQPIFTSLTASSAVATDASKGLVSVTNTGTGNNVLGTAPTISLPVIDNIKMGYSTTATAGATTTLTVSSNYRQFFTGTLAQTIVLPVTSTLVTGMAYEIENNSTGTLTVNSSGGNLVGTIPAGVCAHAVCIGTTLTTAADWDWDYISTTTITGTGANVLGTAPTISNALVTGIRETATVSATAATGTINYDVATQVVLYYTTNASGNFTVNFRSTSSASLDSVMSTGQSLSTTFLVTNGSTAYYNSAVTIDGNSVTPKWQGGSAPTSGNASSIDSYTYVIIKTGSATFTVLASQTKFA